MSPITHVRCPVCMGDTSVLVSRFWSLHEGDLLCPTCALWAVARGLPVLVNPVFGNPTWEGRA